MTGSTSFGAVARRIIIKLLVAATLGALQLSFAAPAKGGEVDWAAFTAPPAAEMRIGSAGLALLKSFEDLRLCAYDDARPHHPLRPGDRALGTLTIGYGHTGPDVAIGDCISEVEAEDVLRADLDIAERAVRRLAPRGLDQHVFDALVSFAFNAGVGAFETSTLLRRINQGEIGAAADELMRWVWTTIDGEKVRSRGLQRRRAAERALMLGEGL